jgi:hypothetical protein
MRICDINPQKITVGMRISDIKDPEKIGEITFVE